MTIIHAAAALAAALLVTPAAAQDTKSQTVAHADLDLRTTRDVARFDHRIWRAAHDLCGTSSSLDLTGRRKDRQCITAAVARVADARTRAIGAAQDIMVAGR